MIDKNDSKYVREAKAREGGKAKPNANDNGKFAGFSALLILFFSLLIFLRQCINSTDPVFDNELNQIRSTGPAGIDPGVYMPYTRDQFPKAFSAWGQSGIDRIQELREAAAKSAAANPSCEFVDMVELSESRSTPRSNPVVYVDCRNGERMYFSEDDLAGEVLTEKQKGKILSGGDLIRQCVEAVRNKLSMPSTLDPNTWSISDTQGESGNRVIQFDFKAKSLMGITLPASAKCIASTGGELEITLIEK